jgi:hypothetical protein
LQLELGLLLTCAFLGLESGKTRLILCLSGRFSLLERTLSKLLLSLTCSLLLLLGGESKTGRFLTSLFTGLLRLQSNVRLELTLFSRHAERRLTELLCCLLCRIVLLLCRHAHFRSALTSSITGLLSAEVKFCLLLTRLFLGLECGQSLLTLSLTSLLAL